MNLLTVIQQGLSTTFINLDHVAVVKIAKNVADGSLYVSLTFSHPDIRTTNVDLTKDIADQLEKMGFWL